MLGKISISRFALLLPLVASCPVLAEEPPLIIGWIENIAVTTLSTEDTPFVVKAKIDTGATTSSIDAEILALPEESDSPEVEETIEDTEEEEEEEQEYPPLPPEKSETPPLRRTVIFSVKDSNGNKKVVERKLERWVRIKKKTSGVIRRPVVKMEFCIAGRLVEEEVNLSERKHFTYAVLIGRNMLKEGNYLVNSAKTFAGKPRCATSEKSS